VILDTPIDCPRCGKKTSLADEVTCGGKVVLRLCSLCAEKPLDQLLVHFRSLVRGISGAVDRHCPECAGRGWHISHGHGGQAFHIRECAACSCTGIDMKALLAVLEIAVRPRPKKNEPLEGFSPGASLRGKDRSR